MLAITPRVMTRERSARRKTSSYGTISFVTAYARSKELEASSLTSRMVESGSYEGPDLYGMCRSCTADQLQNDIRKVQLQFSFPHISTRRCFQRHTSTCPIDCKILPLELTTSSSKSQPTLCICIAFGELDLAHTYLHLSDPRGAILRL